jgi:predicted short-subunit dehydrogenase-like oxidoreductase (DUF2520 family)
VSETDRGIDRGTDPDTDRTFALVGPGRAGTTIALALVAAGWTPVGVAGRAPDAESTRAAAVLLECPALLVTDAGRGARVVVVATPDGAVPGTALALASSVERGALVIHLAGSMGVGVFDELLSERPDLRVGALHPLQTLPSARLGLERLGGAWAAYAGDDEVAHLAAEIGLRPFLLPDEHRMLYHATAVVASNHVVALLGQVERMADIAGVPFAAFSPIARAAVENAFGVGAAAALTGPIARGDLQTVARHLAALPPSERDAYRALAREAAKLAGRRQTGAERLMRDLEQRPHAEP